MITAEDFDAQPWAPKLARRREHFKQMLLHVARIAEERNGGATNIIETGTAWDKDNWVGQGQSTLVFDWLAGHYDNVGVTSIDLRKEAADTASLQTSHVRYVTGDSPKVLNDREQFSSFFLNQTYLLYLDSFDWTPEGNMDSAFHHIVELAAVWADLPNNCMVVVDDRHGDMKGKHWLVEHFMIKLGIKPCFKGHQMGWIKK